MELKKELLEFLEANNWFSLEDRENAEGVIDSYLKVYKEQLTLTDVVICVYVVTERDNYGDQTFKDVFANKEKAIEYLAKEGLEESNIDEINEIELN